MINLTRITGTMPMSERAEGLAGGGSGAAEGSLRSEIGTRDASGVDIHANQLTVSLETVRELVDEQFPERRGGPVRGVASQGTVNALVRIGDKFLARFPELVTRLAELGVPAPKVSVTPAGVIERQSIGKLRGIVPLLSAPRG